MSTPELPDNAPAPRLCHLFKWEDFDGYGFSLHAEKSRSGQFIGKVDQDSPALHASLNEGDRIIEVNGVNIANENHRQVVERIKAIPNETKLLVVDEEADRWYKERKIVVKSTQSNVLYSKTPVPRPTLQNSEAEPPSYENITVAQNGSAVNGKGVIKTIVEQSPKLDEERSSNNKHCNGEETNGKVHHHSPAEQKKPVLERRESPALSSKGDNSPKPREEVDSRSSTPMEENSGSAPDSPRSQNGVGGGDVGLNLNMSASEMRLMLASRKKKDPKKVPMDIRQKYDIIQEM